MNNNTIFYLVDLGDSFLLHDNKRKIRLPYGLFSMMIGSIDVKAARELFADEEFSKIMASIMELSRVYTNIQKWNEMEHCNPAIGQPFQLLYEPIKEFLNTGHLEEEQLSLITELFLHEIRLHALYNKQPKSFMDLMPRFLHMDSLQIQMKNLLLRNTKIIPKSLQEEMNRLQLAATLDMTEKEPHFVYHVEDTVDIFLVDLVKYLNGEKTAKECQYCHRMFYPRERSTAKYCRLPHKDSNKTCDYIMHHLPKDELQKMYNNAKRQQARKCSYGINIDNYGEEFLERILQKWKSECEKKYIIAQQTGNIDEFKRWIEETKFLKRRLAELKRETF